MPLDHRGERKGAAAEWPVERQGTAYTDEEGNGWMSDGRRWRIYSWPQPCMHCGKPPYSKKDPRTQGGRR